jgi:hypothetical protein
MQGNAIQQLWGCSSKNNMDVNIAQTKQMRLIRPPLDSQGNVVIIKRVSVKKPEGKRSLERSKYRWEDNIKTEKEIGWKSVDSFDLA